jgi:hypothetical protein
MLIDLVLKLIQIRTIIKFKNHRYYIMHLIIICTVIIVRIWHRLLRRFHTFLFFTPIARQSLRARLNCNANIVLKMNIKRNALYVW